MLAVGGSLVVEESKAEDGGICADCSSLGFVVSQSCGLLILLSEECAGATEVPPMDFFCGGNASFLLFVCPRDCVICLVEGLMMWLYSTISKEDDRAPVIRDP